MEHRTKKETGSDTATPINFELGGRPGAPTVAVLRNFVRNLAEARCARLLQQSRTRGLHAAIDRTMARAQADALIASFEARCENE